MKRVLKRDVWSKNRNKPLRRNINRKKQVSRQFSCLWYIQLETFPKIVWYELSRFRQPWQVFLTSIQISPWILIRVRETFGGEWSQLNVITCLICDFNFFSNGKFSSGIFSDFFRIALFSEKLLLHTSLTISTPQLLFRSIYFFRAVAFLRSSVFEIFISSQLLFFQNT